MRSTLFTPVPCTYGAPMGRPNVSDYLRGEEDLPRRFRLERIRWTAGAYDQGGAYWGGGADVYLAVFNGLTLAPGETEPVEEYIRRSYRAKSRADAAAQLRAEFPGAVVRGVK
jgi:hypothetical protein